MHFSKKGRLPCGMLRCTEILEPNDAMGHERHIEHAPATSASPLTANIRLRCNILRGGQLRHFATQQMASSTTVSASNCIDLEIGILERMGLRLNKEAEALCARSRKDAD